MTNFGTTVSNSRRKPLDVRKLHKMDERKHQDRHGKLAQVNRSPEMCVAIAKLH